MPRAPLVLLLAAALLVPVAVAAFPQDPPNDPRYAPAEKGGWETCLQRSVNDAQHYLYSFMPRCAVNAKDPEGASGMSVDLAWKLYGTGRPDVLIAYVEGGINWHADDVEDLVEKVFLNVGELPLPQDASGSPAASHDLNGDGRVSAADYAADPRVADANGNGRIDPEDLIVAFSDGADDDANGFVDDVSGWDFYDKQNDPATADATYDHANNQMRQAAAETDNGFLGAGVCPRCMVLPIKAGAEALDRTDDLAAAWLYAARMGASVIVSVTADLGYSSFMAQVVEKLWRDGVVMVEASNDFDSLDHQGGMFWPHVLPGNGLVTNTRGLPDPWTSNALTTTFRTRSDETSWGTKATFSVATQGGSTSTSTPTTGGVVALVLSAGLDAWEAGTLASPLTGPEAIQVLVATASDVDDPALAWPGKPGWDLQYGYGRPNVAKAMGAVRAGEIPPTPSLLAPSWYALFDPTTTATVTVEGRVAARVAPYAWVLEWAPGAEPADADFVVAGSGAGAAPTEGVLGTIDLASLPASFWAAPFRMSKDKSLESNDMYTVTIRLRAVDAAGRLGEDRRAIAVHHDPDWLPGFPLRIGPGGESQPALADLHGLGRKAVVFGDSDGRVHAIDGATALPLPGWPAATDATVPHAATPGIDPGHEPVLAPVAVGDLDGDGEPEVVATATTGKVYVFDRDGKRLAGWPRAATDHAVTPPIPRPALAFSRLPHAGATASPALFDLDGDGKLEIVQASWDGRVYAWRLDGSALPGWPVHVALPASLTPPPGFVVVNDAKIVTTPAIADFEGDSACWGARWGPPRFGCGGDGRPEVVVQSQVTFAPGAGIQPHHRMHVFAFHADGSPVAGWPVQVPGLVMYYGSGQEFITEGSTAPAVADVDGDGRDEVAVSPVFSPTVLLDARGAIRAVYGPAANPFAEVVADAFAPGDPASGDLPGDAVITFTTSGAFGRVAGAMTYAQAGSGAASTAAALLLTGSGVAIKNYERAYDAATGAPRPGFPALIQGLNFLGAPILVDVTGDGIPEVVDGGDSSAMHAFDAVGRPVPGFPKFHTGWTVFSPSAGDVDGDGKTDLVATTREGYLFAWRTAGDATSAGEWWTYHHDEWRTGRHGTDPSAPRAPAGADALPATGAILLVAGAVVLARRSAR